jgi:hypothetical protein
MLHALSYAHCSVFAELVRGKNDMDTSRFDRMAMSFAQEPSRRDLLRLLGGAALGAGGLMLLESDGGEAKRHKHKKRKKKGATCKDGRQNGSETDVDCGGSCPRCRAGKSCETRDDCTTALCVDGACLSPVNADECGLDADGETCFARDSVNADRFCSRKTCKLFPGGSCDDCTGEEQCAPAGGNDIECCAPCGSPL